jgi:hypothetical protein
MGRWAATVVLTRLRKKKNGPGNGRWAAAERKKYGLVGKKRGREGDWRRRDWAERKGEGFRFFLFFFKPFSNLKFFSNFKHFQNFSRLKSF